MRRTTIFAIAGLSLLCLAGAAGAGEVYQWKDANGVTHYSQTPPAKGQYQQRQITNRGAGVAQTATQAAAAPPENAQCAAARANLAVLKGAGPVREQDADGKAGRVLSDADKASQTELANAAIKAYCTPAG